ncbi:hypothetical protein NDU88_006758 [Pleurodeles waltl]|uniref:Uncharacterized protein n=1 Tax=Pleurodeles waltl TaxID=8319 RepID=A0AAV7RR26_PLEWA|nr:hypothetical protein NDU88_006758 [Pleurodeles waltl]
MGVYWCTAGRRYGATVTELALQLWIVVALLVSEADAEAGTLWIPGHIYLGRDRYLVEPIVLWLCCALTVTVDGGAGFSKTKGGDK